ncbi:DUF4369 domain-containing protein [Spirosoma gilvum]
MPNLTSRISWLLLSLFFSSLSISNAQLTSRIDCYFPAAWEGKETKLISRSIDQPIQVDTAFIINRRVTFTVNSTDLCSAYIWIEGNPKDIHFLIDSPQINIAFDPQSSIPILISGSPSSELWRQQRDLLHQQSESNTELMPSFPISATSEDSLMRYIELADSLHQAYSKSIAAMIQDNPVLPSSWYLFATHYTGFPFATTKRLFNQLAIFSAYPSYQKIAVNLLTKEPGKLATDFTLPTLSGESITLSTINSKLTLIDFSDALMLSRKPRHKALRKIYQTFHPLGLEILTVARAFDQKSAKEAFQTEKIPWPVALSVIGQSKVTDYYNVDRTPDNVLLDQQKRIIARDLSVDELAFILNGQLKK